MFCRVLPSFPGFHGVSSSHTEFNGGLPSFVGFYGFFTEVYRGLPACIEVYRLVSRFTELYEVLPGMTRFSTSFAPFYFVLLSSSDIFIGFTG